MTPRGSRNGLAARVLAGLLGLCLAPARAGFAAPIAVSCQPLLLDPADAARETVGRLRYRGGLLLRSPDPRFGGLSGLRVAPDGRRLLAVSDEGYWFSAFLEYDAHGRLRGLRGAEIGPLQGLDGQPLEGKSRQDAESLVLLPEGGALVGFEREQRIWRYPGSPNPFLERPVVVPPPDGLEKAPSNSSLEALTLLGDGRLLALSEGLEEDGAVRGWLLEDGQWSALSYRTDGAPRPSDAATLPDGDVVVVERSFSPAEGLHLRLRLVAAKAIRPAARLDGPLLADLHAPPLNLDNLEGVSARASGDGETLLYLVSDDNYDSLQRTLLLLFSLEPDPRPVTAR